MSKKHGLIMIACCFVALGAGIAVFMYNVQINIVIFILLLLICVLPIITFYYDGHDGA